MRRLRDEGRTIVYVTHFLEHVIENADRVTVLRDGEKVLTAPVVSHDKSSLVAAMIGADTDISYPARPPLPKPETAPMLCVRQLETDTRVNCVDLEIRPGEILGLIGLVGSGRSEIARAIAGVDAVRSGQVLLNDENIAGRSQREIIRRGLVMVPEERRRQGLVMTASVRGNISLPHLARYSRFGVLSTRSELSRVRELAEFLGIVPSGPERIVATLSGGNQQKVLLGKWLMEKPRLVILDEPTKGVDVGARRMINESIMELAAGGVGILLISSEIEEVLGLAHRALLVEDGRFLGEVDCADTDTRTVLNRLFATENPEKPN